MDTEFQLKGDLISYNADFGPENSDLSVKNTHFWSDIA